MSLSHYSEMIHDDANQRTLRFLCIVQLIFNEMLWSMLHQKLKQHVNNCITFHCVYQSSIYGLLTIVICIQELLKAFPNVYDKRLNIWLREIRFDIKSIFEVLCPGVNCKVYRSLSHTKIQTFLCFHKEFALTLNLP